jgi:cytochrome c biogenesis protein CcmG/thiol:disulfide interchange protein DsbE
MEPAHLPPRPRPRWRWAIGAALLAPTVGVLVLLAHGFVRDPRYIPSPLLGRAAWPFALPLLDGGEVRLAQLRGQVVVVNFWASWCPPCRQEARTLEAAWRRFKDEGVVFVGVNTLDDEASARAFVQEFGLTYPNGIDTGGRITVAYGVWGLPETFVIDRHGRITYKHVGAIGAATLVAKLEEAAHGEVSRAEGRGEYLSTR